MRPPGWWWDARPGAAALALRPVGALYAAATARRLRAAAPFRAPVPVIRVGNVEAGGAGKTPAVIALIDRLEARGLEPQVVSRGHGGRLRGPVRVARQGADEVGDEPLLIAAFAPAWVSRDRAAGVQAAVEAGAGAVVLDDGHQNGSVAADLSLLVADAARGWGNGLCIPAGPLREPVAAALSRADLLVTVGDADGQAAFGRRWGERPGGLPRLQAELRPLPTGMPWAGLRVLAFAGIGNPRKFFDTLRGLGAAVVAERPLDDHQPLPSTLMLRLDAEARALGAQLVTTEKDAVRLPPDWRGRVLALPVRLQADDWAPLDWALDRALDALQPQGSSAP